MHACVDWCFLVFRAGGDCKIAMIPWLSVHVWVGLILAAVRDQVVMVASGGWLEVWTIWGDVAGGRKVGVDILPIGLAPFVGGVNKGSRL